MNNFSYSLLIGLATAVGSLNALRGTHEALNEHVYKIDNSSRMPVIGYLYNYNLMRPLACSFPPGITIIKTRARVNEIILGIDYPPLSVRPYKRLPCIRLDKSNYIKIRKCVEENNLDIHLIESAQDFSSVYSCKNIIIDRKKDIYQITYSHN